MHPLYEKASRITGLVIESSIAVYKHFGPGLLESIYVKCLAHELELNGHDVEVERAVVVTYRGKVFREKLRFDLIVDSCLLIEAKVTDSGIRPEHVHQLLSYMKLMDIPLGLVINFGEIRFSDRGVKRVILKGANQQI